MSNKRKTLMRVTVVKPRNGSKPRVVEAFQVRDVEVKRLMERVGSLGAGYYACQTALTEYGFTQKRFIKSFADTLGSMEADVSRGVDDVLKTVRDITRWIQLSRIRPPSDIVVRFAPPSSVSIRIRGGIGWFHDVETLDDAWW